MRALTVTKAAQELQCSVSTIHHKIKRGELNATKHGKVWAVDPDSVMVLVEAGYTPDAARAENGRRAAKSANTSVWKKRTNTTAVRKRMFSVHNSSL